MRGRVLGLPCQLSPENTRDLVTMATDLLHPRNGTTVLRVGVAYLAKALQHYPTLAAPFVTALLALPGDVRARLLNLDGPKDELPVGGGAMWGDVGVWGGVFGDGGGGRVGVRGGCHFACPFFPPPPPSTTCKFAPDAAPTALVPLCP
jgi:hypothetical protein